jgi:hypothetical protein
MNQTFRKTLLTAAITALLSTPAWAATSPGATPGATPGQPESQQPGIGEQRGMGEQRDLGEQRGLGQQPGMGQQPEMGQRPGTELDRDAPTARTDPGHGTPQATGPEGEIYNRTPGELRGMEVRDSEGEKIGTVKNVVLGPLGENLHAVIASGGFMGFGGREFMVAVDEMELQEDQLHVTTATKEQLQARVPTDDPEGYTELEQDRPLSEFAAFETQPNGADRPQTQDRMGDPMDRMEDRPGDRMEDRPQDRPQDRNP